MINARNRSFSRPALAIPRGRCELSAPLSAPLSALAAAILMAAMLAGPRLAPVHGQTAGEVKTQKRTLRSGRGDAVEYEVGTLFVPENRSDPESRVIGVGFARFPATAQPAAAPPVFQLPGGPGDSYVQRLKSASADELERRFALSSLRAFGDVVFVDQRGFSEGGVLTATYLPPAREPDQPRKMELEVAAFEKFARETVADFARRHIDLRGYTVKECAQDVADLSQALGYPRITLHGGSFGSQWSFAVIRQHPQLVARALLTGVEPLDHGYDMPSHVFAAVQRMWRTVDEDPRFQPYLPEGGLAEAALAVIQRLERQPLRVEVEDRESGARSTIAMIGPADFPWRDPSRILELYHGHTERFGRALAAGGRPRRISLIGPLIDSSLGATPERRYRLQTDPATRYLGRGGFTLYLATAEIWPSPDVGDAFRTPELCETPVVFAQGDWDTQTPIENTFEIAPFFINSRTLIAERGGHGVLDNIAQEQPQVWATLLEFLRTGDMEAIPARVRLRPSQRFSPPTFPPPPQRPSPPRVGDS